MFCITDNDFVVITHQVELCTRLLRMNSTLVLTGKVKISDVRHTMYLLYIKHSRQESQQPFSSKFFLSTQTNIPPALWPRAEVFSFSGSSVVVRGPR